MSHIVEQAATTSDLAGMGKELIRLKNTKTGEVLAFIGQFENKECISFPRPIKFEDVIAVAEILQKKKFNKAMNKNEFDKAEGFMNKKFNQR